MHLYAHACSSHPFLHVFNRMMKLVVVHETQKGEHEAHDIYKSDHETSS